MSIVNTARGRGTSPASGAIRHCPVAPPRAARPGFEGVPEVEESAGATRKNMSAMALFRAFA